MEVSSRIGSKSSVGEASTEGDGDASMSRTWSKGSAGEDSVSRAWSKGSAGEDVVSRAWSKTSSAQFFFGRSPSWSVASDLSPRGEGLGVFGRPWAMVTETQKATETPACHAPGAKAAPERTACHVHG